MKILLLLALLLIPIMGILVYILESYMKVTKGSLWEASSRPTGRLFTFPPLKPMEKDLLLFWRFVKEQRVYGNYSKSLSPLACTPFFIYKKG
jgi:hypothetical protein